MIGQLVRDELRASAELYWSERGREWTESLPGRVAEVCDRWGLQLRRTYPGASTAFVAEVTRGDGSAAVVKVGFPEIVGEAEALAAYGGNGAAELYDFDSEHNAMLIERCPFGSTLGSLTDDDQILTTACALLRRLWQTPPPPNIPTLRGQCELRSVLGEVALAEIDHAGFGEMAREGLFLLASLSDSADDELLLHGDLHPRNIQRAIREPWLVIDPAPLRGDPAYEPIPLVLEAACAYRAPLGEDRIIARVGFVARRLGLSPARVASWGVARRVDWALFCHTRHDYQGAMRAFTEAGWFHTAMALYENDQ